MNTIDLGRLALSASVAALLGALLAGYIAGLIARRWHKDEFDSGFFNIVLAGAIGGRLGFVAQYASTYAAAPLTILDIRDGGFDVAGWMIGSLAMAAWSIGKQKNFSKSLGISVLVAALAYAAAVPMLAARRGGEPMLATTGLVSLDGKPASLQAFAGKPIVVSLWTTWCGYCKRQMPILAEAQRNQPEVVYLFVSQGEGAAVVQQYVNAMPQPVANVLLDPRKELGKLAGSTAVPTTLFVGKDGKVDSVRVGTLSPATLEQRLAALR
jgi:thiol-disulfide isomerase/thioredoxin/uncharacterized membrane protein YeaQ/YmgE (transglycosylase-associated protein family)